MDQVMCLVPFVLLPFLSAEAVQPRHKGTEDYCLSHGCTECPAGYYGPDCKKPCVGCTSNGCEISSGKCHHCKAGMFGKVCSKPCPVNCSSDHGHTEPVCDRHTGSCTIGCKGNMCSSHCDQQCPSKCLHGTCTFTDCKCECQGGFYGPGCECKNTPVSSGLCFALVWIQILWIGFGSTCLWLFAKRNDIHPLRCLMYVRNCRRVKNRGFVYHNVQNPSDLSDESMEELFRSLPFNGTAPTFGQQEDFYDDFRVDIEDGSINASFITGFDGGERRYICTEEPVPSKITDFWSMVKEYKCACVVVLSGGKQIGSFGRQHVMAGITSEPFFSSTEHPFRWRNFYTETDEGPHLVSMYNYFAWSRHSPNQAIKNFLSFVREEQSFKDRASPVVVLSTDGESAAHAFIVLDCIQDSIESDTETTLDEYVKKLVPHRRGIFHDIDQLRTLRDYYKMVFHKNGDPPPACTLPMVFFWILLFMFALSIVAFCLCQTYCLS